MTIFLYLLKIHTVLHKYLKTYGILSNSLHSRVIILLSFLKVILLQERYFYDKESETVYKKLSVDIWSFDKGLNSLIIL